ncbi:MAG: hypothetical protein WD733_23065 [Bryobacterales bacterium]
MPAQLRGGAHLAHWAAAGLGMFDAMQSFWHDDGTLKPGCGHRRPKKQDAETWTWARGWAHETNQRAIIDLLSA